MVPQLLAQDYDAILIDCQMTKVNGFQATRSVRALATVAKDTPIIALTASAAPKMMERCIAEGMDDCLLKPSPIEDVARRLIDHIS